MSENDTLLAHLETGDTRVCRCWLVRRKDGTAHGFTDHDRDLSFDGHLFRADTGLSAAMLQQGTGLSVDNTEAVGALTGTAITEADIEAGRFDGAEVTAWLVDWSDPKNRMLQFHGTLGEIRRAGGAFHAELRGQTEALNQAQGQVYHGQCSAVLGDARCGVDLGQPGLSAEVAVTAVEDRQQFVLEGLAGYEEGWFTRGRMKVLDGAAAGLVGVVKTDRRADGARQVALWQPLGAAVAAGDRVRVEAGCDKQAGTCKAKFGNFLRFRGFPHIPGEDWLMSYPVSAGDNSGGRLR